MTIIPLTPRNGTDGLTIAGTWTTLNVTPAFWMSETAHGPVIQNGVCDFVNAVSQME